jgi:hypothetical protein
MALDLPRATLTGLNQAYKKLLDAHAQLDKLERAGEDVSGPRAELQAWQEKVSAHKREFFPDAQ